MKVSDLLHLLRRQGLTFFVVFGSGVLLTAIVILFAPRRYQSQAMLLLRMGRENVALDPTITTTGEATSLYRTSDSEVNTALQMMASRSVLEKVLDDVGDSAILRGSLDPGAKLGGVWSNTKAFLKSIIARIDPIEDHERALLELQDGLKIDAERESRVVSVVYRTKTPELAQRVAQSWVSAYRAEHSRMNAVEGSVEFFQKQESDLVRLLQYAREALQARKSEYGLVTIDGGQQILEKQMEWTRSSLLQSQAQLAASEARLTSLEKQQNETDATIVTSEATADTNAARERMRDRLFALEIEERDLSTRFSKDHPVYQAALEQLEEARRVFEAQQDDASETILGMNPLHLTMQEQISTENANQRALEAEVNSLQQILANLTRELQQLNMHEAELAALERNVEVLENQYRSHFEKREQSRLAAELETRQLSNINVIQAPTLERRPASPNKKICALLGLLSSLLLAVGITTLREANHQIKNHQEGQPSTPNEDGQDEAPMEMLPANEFVSSVSVR